MKDGILINNYVIDHYIRIEFQFRGSPHAHILLWLNDAPKYIANNKESIKQCETFVDKWTTTYNDVHEDDNSLVKYQIHKHTRTCHKKNKHGTVCRFHFPLFPLDVTKIIQPLSENTSNEQMSLIKINYENVRRYLASVYKNPPNMTFDEFLNLFQLTKEEYYLVIAYTLKKPRGFVKREVNAINVNAYQPEILNLFQSNIDFQFILDVYSCAHYVVNYLSKSHAGMSKLLYDIGKEIEKGNLELKEKLKMLSNAFLNASEFSAQEAAYYLLSLPISECSRDCVFINTNVPEKRIHVIKSTEELENMESSSEDVFIQSSIDYYVKRLANMENVCLADFVALYRCNNNKKIEDSNIENINEAENEDNNIGIMNHLELKDTTRKSTKKLEKRTYRYLKAHLC